MRLKLSLILSLTLSIACALHGGIVNVPAGGDVAAAVSAAGANGTIQLSRGGYTIPAMIQLLPGQTVVGTTKISQIIVLDTTTLPPFVIPTPQYTVTDDTQISCSTAAFAPAAGVTLRNLSPQCTLLLGLNGNCDKISVQQCAFTMKQAHPQHRSSIEWTGGLWSNLDIGDCLFRDPVGATVQFIWTADATGICHNLDFIGSGDHIHLNAYSQATAGMQFKEIHSSGESANVLEYQYCGSNVSVDHWWMDSPNYSAYRYLLGASCPSDQSKGTMLNGLVVLALGQSDNTKWQRIMLEDDSVDSKVTNCFCLGVRKPIGSSNPRTTGSVSNCYFDPSCPEASDTSGGGGTVNTIKYSNVQDASVRATLLAAGRPGAMFRLGGVVAQSLPFSAAVAIGDTVGADGGGISTFTFSNVPAGVAQVQVAAAATGNPADARGLFSKTVPYTNPMTIGGQTPGYVETWTPTLLDKNGAVLGVATVTGPKANAGSSLAAWPIPPPTTDPTPVDPDQVAILKSQLAQSQADNAALKVVVSTLQAWISNVKALVNQ